MFRVLILAAVIAVALGAIESMNFKDLEADTTMKLVLFHDPNVESSVDAMTAMKEISDMPEFNQMYLFKYCDVSEEENKPAVEAGLTGGTVFTHTPEAGIDGFGGTLGVDSFRSFHEFRTTEVDGDKVVAVKKLSEVFKLAEEKPVFLKMYEQWCGHCKKMKKHFQYASAQADQKVHYVEVECSAAGNLCEQFGVQGYPTVRLLAKVDGEYMTYDYDDARTHGALAEFGANALDKAEGKLKAYKGVVPKEGDEDEDEDEDDEDDEDEDDEDEDDEDEQDEL